MDLIAGLARVIRAQRHAAQAGKLLWRESRVLPAIEVAPEILVQPAAIHSGDVCRWRVGLHVEKPGYGQHKTRRQRAGANR
jgi:hypothetical protein